MMKIKFIGPELGKWEVYYTAGSVVVSRPVDEDFASMLLRAKDAGREELATELRTLIGARL